MAKESAGAGRIGFLRTAERLYTGELLPEFSTELWVIERNLQLKGMYQQAVVELGEYLRQAGEYQEELRLYRKAGKLYPFDKWQIQEIDCLMLLKEYTEAYDVYRNTAKLYCEELGVPPGPEMVSRLRWIESQIKNPVGNFDDL